MAPVTMVELRVGRKNTTQLIESHPITESIQRPKFVSTDAGGRKVDGFLSLPPQTFTVIPLSGLVWDRSDTTSDEGRLPDVTEQVVGEWDMDLRKDDHILWNHNGLQGYLLVVHVSRNRHFRTSGLTRFIEGG